MVCLIILDRASPQMIRTYGVGLFAWGERGNAEAFYARYGWVSFPRTLFLVLASISVSINQWVHIDEVAHLSIAIGAVLLWVVFVARDAWRARKAAED